MKILALTRYARLGASSRIRIIQYGDALANHGIDVDVSPLLSDDYLLRQYAGCRTDWLHVMRCYVRRLGQLATAGRYDLLWIEKELFPNLPAWFERWLTLTGKRYVVDYDDAVFPNDLLNPHPLKWLIAGKIDSVMRHASMTVCGNDYIAARAAAAGARNICTLPSVIDLERYTCVEPPVRQRIVVGWIGSPSTAPYLTLVLPALRQLAARYPITLRVVGAQFEATGIDVECRPWTEAAEVQEISDFDIGIMPLFDTQWERGKCGYKLIQYMACGRPVVASPIGINEKIVRAGQTGYLATTTKQWHDALSALCSQRGERSAMGARGRLDVEEHYCLQVTVQQVAGVLREAAP